MVFAVEIVISDSLWKNEIIFKVVEHGMFVKHCKVEVYYVELKLIENSNHEKVIKKKFSKSDTIVKFICLSE